MGFRTRNPGEAPINHNTQNQYSAEDCAYKRSLFLLLAPFNFHSIQSAMLKYDRYLNANRPAYKVFDDLLGFRLLCANYSDILNLSTEEHIRIIDMSQGKSVDDGYRGVHLYFQLSNFHYPIEVQFNTDHDRQFNDWLHKYIYKKDYSSEVGRQLRVLHEQEKIINEIQFKEALKNVSDSKTL